MSYHKAVKTEADLASTPSYLFNNLSAGPGVLLYAHRDTVYGATVESLEEGKVAEASAVDSKASRVLQTSWVKMGPKWMAVVATTTGFSIFDQVMNRTLYAWSLEDDVEASKLKASFCTGIAYVDGGSRAFVGASNGKVYAVNSGAGGFVADKPFVGHKDAVSALDADEKNLASGDYSGSIIVRNAETGALLAEFGDAKGPITGIAIRGDVLVASDVSGRVFVYSVESKCLLAEATGHAKCITSLACQRGSKGVVFATGGEDAKMNIWSFDGKLNLVLSETVTDYLFTGLAFMGAKLYGVSFDVHAVQSWTPKA